MKSAGYWAVKRVARMAALSVEQRVEWKVDWKVARKAALLVDLWVVWLVEMSVGVLVELSVGQSVGEKAVHLVGQRVVSTALHWVVCLVAWKEHQWAGKKVESSVVKRADSMAGLKARQWVAQKVVSTVEKSAVKMAGPWETPRVVLTAAPKAWTWAVHSAFLKVVPTVENLEPCSVGRLAERSVDPKAEQSAGKLVG